MTIQSTIKYSAYYHSDENDAESDPKSDPLVATCTSDGKKIKSTDNETNNGNYSQKLFIKPIIPEIIPVVNPPFDQTTADGVAASGGNFHAVCTILSNEIVMDTARSAAHIFKHHMVVNWKDKNGTIPWDGNTVEPPAHIDYPSLDWCWNLCLPK